MDKTTMTRYLCHTCAAPTDQKTRHQILPNETSKVMNWSKKKNKKTQGKIKVCLASMHSQGCLGQPVFVSVGHRKSQTCNGDKLYLHLGPLSGIICRPSLSRVSSGNRKRVSSFCTNRTGALRLWKI